MNPELVQNRPEYAENLRRLSETFERLYVLNSDKERANFIEGMREFAMLIARDSSSASISLQIGGNGLVGINVSAAVGQ